jgi:hypothetical protein
LDYPAYWQNEAITELLVCNMNGDITKARERFKMLEQRLRTMKVSVDASAASFEDRVATELYHLSLHTIFNSCFDYFFRHMYGEGSFTTEVMEAELMHEPESGWNYAIVGSNPVKVCTTSGGAW